MASTSNTFKNHYGGRNRKLRVKNKLDKKIVSLAKKVYEQQEQETVELKTFDMPQISTIINNDPLINVFKITNEIPQGTAYNQRVGDQITLKSLFMRFHMYSTSSGIALRMILVRSVLDRVPSWATVMQDGTGLPYLSAFDIDYKEDFQILYDNLYALSAVGANQSVVDKLYVNLKNRKTTWVSGGGLVPDTGNLYLMIITNSSTAVTLNLNARLRFTDA